MKTLTISEESKFLSYLSDLIPLTDSFDQVTKIALMCDMLYAPTDPVHSVLFTFLETAARRLARLPQIGITEVGHD